MRKIFQSIRAFFRRMAIYVVTAYANRIYRKAVETAEKRHEQEKEMIYVCNGAINASALVTYNRKQFRNAKRILHVYDNKSYNIDALKKVAWYHTANRLEKEGLSDKAKELRRLAFVKNLLQQAKLVD